MSSTQRRMSYSASDSLIVKICGRYFSVNISTSVLIRKIAQYLRMVANIRDVGTFQRVDGEHVAYQRRRGCNKQSSVHQSSLNQFRPYLHMLKNQLLHDDYGAVQLQYGLNQFRPYLHTLQNLLLLEVCNNNISTYLILIVVVKGNITIQAIVQTTLFIRTASFIVTFIRHSLIVLDSYRFLHIVGQYYLQLQ